MKRIMVPGGIVLLVVFAYLALSGWNRSAPPEQTIVLTERELPLRFGSVNSAGDDPGLQLQLQYEHRVEPLDARNWLSEDRLRSIGFALEVPAGSPDAARIYARMLRRIGWVVLEYDGPAFQEIERRRDLQPEKYGPWRGQLAPTRLVPVDAGPDFAPLRAKYPPNHLIVRAIIALNYLGPSSGGPLYYGTVREVIPSKLTVPAAFREVLRGLPDAVVPKDDAPQAPMPPRYEVGIASGPLGLMYVKEVKRLGQ